MNALLIIAHGSRNPQSNAEIERLAKSLGRLPTDRLHGFDRITHGFLELAEPDIQSAINELVIQGANEIVVLPYFLAGGNHVEKDVPAIIDQSRKVHSNVDITVTRHFGAASSIPDCIFQHLENT